MNKMGKYEDVRCSWHECNTPVRLRIIIDDDEVFDALDLCVQHATEYIVKYRGQTVYVLDLLTGEKSVYERRKH